ncbi:hypothetical protein Ciccas_005539 [Cichlidogyrus casuarinus]|uniref:Uncharacterized protein n=1 Tax=Cichlidogyrus casuarinus TaxID=1844966 RepID=A0ABD2Q8F4_9PLAT
MEVAFIDKLSRAERPFMRCRRFIPHGHAKIDDKGWRPHNQALDPHYTYCGPDHSSSIRHLPPYKDDTARNELIWPDHCSHIRTFEATHAHGLSDEWFPYQNGFRVGKKCLFNECDHERSMYGAAFYTLEDEMNRKRNQTLIDKRPGLAPAKSLGDKHYAAPEYSPNFYALDSASPKVRFGSVNKTFSMT